MEQTRYIEMQTFWEKASKNKPCSSILFKKSPLKIRATLILFYFHSLSDIKLQQVEETIKLED